MPTLPQCLMNLCLLGFGKLDASIIAKSGMRFVEHSRFTWNEGASQEIMEIKNWRPERSVVNSACLLLSSTYLLNLKVIGLSMLIRIEQVTRSNSRELENHSFVEFKALVIFIKILARAGNRHQNEVVGSHYMTASGRERAKRAGLRMTLSS